MSAADRDLIAWLIAAVAARTPIEEDVDAATPVYRYGLDSRALMEILEEAERRFDRVVDLERASPAETIAALAAALLPASDAAA